MKISHSASPRNRSSRNSRSAPTGSRTPGSDAAGAVAVSRAIAPALPASGGPKIRSAMDVIWHRLGLGPRRKIVSVRNLQAKICGGPGGRAFGPELCWNDESPAIWFRLKFWLRCYTIWKESSRMYRTITRQIEVTVEPNFLPERSSVEHRQCFWSYTIVITNTGEETVQLRTRHWIITDATGRKQEVRGEGVVGEQPVLAPGERFEYTSGVPLPTASGFMTGRYQMVSESGERFEIDVPTFSLDRPEKGRVVSSGRRDRLAGWVVRSDTRPSPPRG